ncbi:MAG: hypothetical protein M3436_07995 [Pseudomonadota bacterium]|nr:hypothetical protein [Pseudomonadota bacterium]
MTTIELAAGQVVSGPQFSEPMRVETVQSNGAGIPVAGLVGIRPEQRRDESTAMASC